MGKKKANQRSGTKKKGPLPKPAVPEASSSTEQSMANTISDTTHELSSVINARLLCDNSFLEAAEQEDCPADLDVQEGHVELTLGFLDVPELLGWFTKGLGSGDAVLAFTPALTKEQRAMVHRIVGDNFGAQLETASEGTGDARHIRVYKKGSAPRKQTPVELQEQAGFLYKVARDAGITQFSRDELVEQLANNCLTEELASLWQEKMQHGAEACKLVEAAKQGDLETIKAVATANPRLVSGHIQAPPDGLLPLHCAVQENQVDAIRLLVELGAGLEVRDGRGKTPLQVARTFEQCDAEAVLLHLGAVDPYADKFPLTLKAAELAAGVPAVKPNSTTDISDVAAETASLIDRPSTLDSSTSESTAPAATTATAVDAAEEPQVAAEEEELTTDTLGQEQANNQFMSTSDIPTTSDALTATALIVQTEADSLLANGGQEPSAEALSQQSALATTGQQLDGSQHVNEETAGAADQSTERRRRTQAGGIQAQPASEPPETLLPGRSAVGSTLEDGSPLIAKMPIDTAASPLTSKPVSHAATATTSPAPSTPASGNTPRTTSPVALPKTFPSDTEPCKPTAEITPADVNQQPEAPTSRTPETMITATPTTEASAVAQQHSPISGEPTDAGSAASATANQHGADPVITSTVTSNFKPSAAFAAQTTTDSAQHLSASTVMKHLYSFKDSCSTWAQQTLDTYGTTPIVFAGVVAVSAAVLATWMVRGRQYRTR